MTTRHVRSALVATMATALAATVVPALAHDGEHHDPPGVETQFVTGEVKLPTRFIDGEGGWPGLGRRVWNGTAASNGVIAYVFDVDPETWGGAFVIEDVADRTGEADLDVFLYEEFGDFGGQATPTSTAEYATRAKGGELGFVAPGTRKAVVFTRNGVESTFTYRGFSAPRLVIGKGTGDLTVAAGATVVWVNGTDDYSYVRHVTGGTKAFDSSPKQGTGIPVGQSFSHTFTEAGTYAYQTSAGTGTITVTEGPGVGTPTA